MTPPSAGLKARGKLSGKLRASLGGLIPYPSSLPTANCQLLLPLSPKAPVTSHFFPSVSTLVRI